MLLAEPPAAADRLVHLLVTVIRHVGHAVAVLVIEAVRGNFRFRDQDPDLTAGERGQPLLFHLNVIGAADLHSAGDEPGEQIPLIIELTPGDPLIRAIGQ